MFCKNHECEYINAKLNDTVDYSRTFNSSINVSFVLYIRVVHFKVFTQKHEFILQEKSLLMNKLLHSIKAITLIACL